MTHPIPPAQASDEPMRNKNEQLDRLLFRMDTASSLRRRIEAYNELAALLTPRATADVEQLRTALNDLIAVAERCDSWESFPVDALEAARSAALK